MFPDSLDNSKHVAYILGVTSNFFKVKSKSNQSMLNFTHSRILSLNDPSLFPLYGSTSLTS